MSKIRPSRTMTITFAALMAVLILPLLSSSIARPATAAAEFVPTPCADLDWQVQDPTFTALDGAKAYFGEYEGGAYKIEIPDTWNGELILYAHGYRSSAGTNGVMLAAPTFGNSGWREHVISEGYAWATSSYRCNGYVPGIGLQDTMLLPAVFDQVHPSAAPARTYLTGTSMGGHVTLLGAHEFPTKYDGYFAMCAAGPGLFDYFGAMGAAAEVVTGVQFSKDEPVATTTAKIFGITGTGPDNFTQKGLEMASIMINSSGGPRPFVFQGLNPWFSATISGSKLAGSTDPLSLAATNNGWVYGIDDGLPLSADQINSAARRTDADPAYRGDSTPYNELKPFSGKIARPLMTLHTTGDMYVPIFLERILKKAVDSQGKSDLLVQRIVRATQHCEFSSDETIAAFDDLATWVHDGKRPAGDDVMADLTNAGLTFTNPLRKGDPGTENVTKAMYDAAPVTPTPAPATPTATPVPATSTPVPPSTATTIVPGPPNTGTGTGSTSSSSTPMLAGGAGLVALALLTSFAVRRQR